jgi:hypothetical protein
MPLKSQDMAGDEGRSRGAEGASDAGVTQAVCYSGWPGVGLVGRGGGAMRYLERMGDGSTTMAPERRGWRLAVQNGELVRRRARRGAVKRVDVVY